MALIVPTFVLMVPLKVGTCFQNKNRHSPLFSPWGAVIQFKGWGGSSPEGGAGDGNEGGVQSKKWGVGVRSRGRLEESSPKGLGIRCPIQRISGSVEG